MNYRLIIASAAIVTAIAAALALVPPWRVMIIEMLGFSVPVAPAKQLPPSSAPEPPVATLPNPVTNPDPTSRTEQHQVCGSWQSNGSQKTYAFICRGSGVLQIRQIDSTGRENTGTGTASADGQVQAEIRIARNNRRAYLRLRLSTDGQRLDGTWYGNAAEESGEVSFHRVYP
jgi:hypothetical protein